MMSQHTRQRQTNVRAVMDILDRDKLCVIPSDLLRLLLEDNMALQEKANNINENIVKFLDANTSNMTTIAGHLKDISENIKVIGNANNTSNSTLFEKLDDLKKTFSSTSPPTTRQNGAPRIDESTNRLLQERYTLTQKIHRDEKLCELYTEGLNEAPRYAPPKFRSHIGRNASENEKNHLRDLTIYRVQNQIKIMQDSVVEWKNRMSELDAEIEIFLSNNETIKETISRKIETQMNMARAKTEADSITHLRNTYTKEKARGGEEFLLKTRRHDNSTGFPNRGRGPRKRKRVKSL